MFQVADSRDGRGVLLGVRGLGASGAREAERLARLAMPAGGARPAVGRQCWWVEGQLRCANVYAKSSIAAKREAVEPLHFGVRGLGTAVPTYPGYTLSTRNAPRVSLPSSEPRLTLASRGQSWGALALGGLALLGVGLWIGKLR